MVTCKGSGAGLPSQVARKVISGDKHLVAIQKGGIDQLTIGCGSTGCETIEIVFGFQWATSTVLFQSNSPDFGFRHRSNLSRDSVRALTVNSRSPAVIIEACPEPGSSVFQTTLLEALQCKGTLVSMLVPSPRRPRQQGQSSANVAIDMQQNARTRHRKAQCS